MGNFLKYLRENPSKAQGKTQNSRLFVKCVKKAVVTVLRVSQTNFDELPKYFPQLFKLGTIFRQKA